MAFDLVSCHVELLGMRDDMMWHKLQNLGIFVKDELLCSVFSAYFLVAREPLLWNKAQCLKGLLKLKGQKHWFHPRGAKAREAQPCVLVFAHPAGSTLHTGASSAWQTALVQGSCGSSREESAGFPRIHSLMGRPLLSLFLHPRCCHHPVKGPLGGFHIPCGPLVWSAHPLGGTCVLWDFVVLPANDVWQLPMWGLELWETGLGGAGQVSKSNSSIPLMLN